MTWYLVQVPCTEKVYAVMQGSGLSDIKIPTLKKLTLQDCNLFHTKEVVAVQTQIASWYREGTMNRAVV